jgi:hypothetical protein
MLRISKLKQERARIDKEYEEEIAALRSKKGAQSHEFAEVEYDYHERRKGIDGAIEYTLSQVLIDKANELDVPKPPYTEEQFWDRDEEDGEVSVWLNVNGRAHLRKLIAEHNARTFESRTLWVTKFWLPLLAALVGIIGALTGLFAVMHRNQPVPEKKTPVYEVPIQIKAAKK